MVVPSTPWPPLAYGRGRPRGWLLSFCTGGPSYYNIPDWINSDLRDLNRDHDYFYKKKAKRTGIEGDWNNAKYLKNVANLGVPKAKATYVRAKLEEQANDGANFWREVKKIYPSSKSKSSRSKIQLVSPDTNEHIPELDTADYINDYFTNVGKVDPINMIKSSYSKNTSSRRKRTNKSSHKKRTNESRAIPQEVEFHEEPLVVNLQI